VKKAHQLKADTLLKELLVARILGLLNTQQYGLNMI